MSTARGFRDRDYLRTVEGFFFTVVGNVHPPDRVTAYLKNVPSEIGKWGADARRYDRILRQYTMKDIAGTLRFLGERYPEYLHNSEEMGITFSFVPVGKIDMHLKPEERLMAIQSSPSLDSIEKKALELTGLICSESGVDIRSMGVTGSLLAEIHRPEFSDIDLTVYGIGAVGAVKEGILRLYEKGRLTRIVGDDLEEWSRKKSELYPLKSEEAKIVYSRKWNRGRFDGTLFSMHPVKREDEMREGFGAVRYAPLGMVELTAIVEDVSESSFMPAIYRIRDASMDRTGFGLEIREIVSYEGLYADIAERDESVVCRGKLERVINSVDGGVHYRVLVGSTEAGGTDYVRLLG